MEMESVREYHRTDWWGDKVALVTGYYAYPAEQITRHLRDLGFVVTNEIDSEIDWIIVPDRASQLPHHKDTIVRLKLRGARIIEAADLMGCRPEPDAVLIGRHYYEVPDEPVVVKVYLDDNPVLPDNYGDF